MSGKVDGGSGAQRQPTLHTVTVANLPAHARSPSTLAPYLSRVKNLQLHSITSTESGHIVIKSFDPLVYSRVRELRNIIDLNVVVTLVERPLACVVVGVEPTVKMLDVVQHLSLAGIRVKHVARIQCKRTKQYTKLVRVLTKDRQSLEVLLSTGINILGKHYRVEQAHHAAQDPQH